MTVSPTALSRASSAPRLGFVSLAVAALAGCSSTNSLLQGDRIDYRTEGSRAVSLEVPPDLSQLAKDSRYQLSTGAPVSASSYQPPAAAATPASAPGAAATTPTVAIDALSGTRLERAGTQRWLVTPLTPEQLWPQLRAFWLDSGFVLSTEQADIGVMETDWAENRAKIPDGILRRTLGRVLDSLYSTSERDRFRTRIERTPTGSEIYISHRGMEEVYTSAQKDQTAWQPRAADPQLEAEMLSRLLVKLGAKPEQAQTIVSTPPTTPPRARIVSAEGRPAVQLDEGFDRAWRRVGLSLDRSGFTVEDRDRTQGLYFVRYIVPDATRQEEPGLFSRWFGRSTPKEAQTQRFRIAVRGEGERSLVSVLNAEGGAPAGDTAQRIVSHLADDLK